MLRLPGQVRAALHFHARHHDRFITGPPINVNSDNDGQRGQLTVCEHVLVRPVQPWMPSMTDVPPARTYALWDIEWG